jgi:putative ABC transport system permease protein
MTLWRDFLYACRMLLKKPGFTVIAALSLGLGIGANVTIFSIINGTLLANLDFPQPDRVTVIWTVPLNAPGNRNGVTAGNYLAWKERSQSFSSMGGIWTFSSNIGGEQNGVAAEQLDGERLTASMFDVFGVQPLRGRVLTKDEDLNGNPAPVMILSYQLWQRRFNGDDNVVGKTVLLDNAVTTIIGVMPEHFGLPGDRPDFYAPMGFSPQQLASTASFLQVIGRMKPGVSLKQAQQEMDSLADGLRSTFAYNKNNGARVELVSEAFFQGLKQPLTVLQSAVAFVLLIACANVAGLLLARADGRRTEMAVRTSLGAARGRIVRQLLTESMVLALLGGVIGVFLGWGGIKLVMASLPEGDLPEGVRMSGGVLAFTAAISLLTGLLFGLMPAFQTSKVDLSSTLKEAGRGASDGTARQRVRGALVAFQIGLALVLLVGAGLMMNSFLNIQKNDLGGDPKNLLVFEFRFPQSQLMKPVGSYRGVGLWEISATTGLTYQRLYERIEGLPGVVSATAMGMQFKILGRPSPEPTPQGVNQWNAAYIPITSNYFKTIKASVLQGRDFNDNDTSAAPPVVIINSAMAKRWWPNEDPVGQRIALDFVPDEITREIVGVVGDVRLFQAQKDPRPIVYIPHLQQSKTWQGPPGNIALPCPTSFEPAEIPWVWRTRSGRRSPRLIPPSRPRTFEPWNKYCGSKPAIGASI